MYCHIASIVVLSALSVVSMIYTVNSIVVLCQQHTNVNANKFTYLIGAHSVIFQPYIDTFGSLVYNVFVDGVLIQTTKPRHNVSPVSVTEDAFRMRFAHTLVKCCTKHVTFSKFKIVQNTIIDSNGVYVSYGSPYYINLEHSVLRR